ncbi:SAM-dependent methyltransferase [Inquilinus ginsengisoli]|uniref:SAM-dependent methyltransferase n=1 Tax=Inquilinus ginsengisoli TaxID=363840 RepID=A0ABU1JPF9_9PROT|nr:SAM-dependent methyltransferase [Inquilinus ginsengisoli]MDR6290506.1 SAM-dependent methyltransferase [Inquilinus ginsengisoli]
MSLRISTHLLRPPARALLRSADSIRSWDWLWQPTYGRRWHERFYRVRDDPYGCTVNPYDRQKYDRTLDLLAGRQFPSALEIGCSEGVFTEMVAPRCGKLLGIDLSEQAVERARARLAHLDHVTVMRATLPMEMPPGSHDLILCLDVLYYLPKDVLIGFLPRLKAALRPGGLLFALHYLGDFGQAMRGKEVHDLLVARLGLEVGHDEIVPGVGPAGAGCRVTCLGIPFPRHEHSGEGE